jgi:DNA-binding CsgD family transcriptional regulator
MWSPASPRAASVLEAAYRVDAPVEEWLAAVLATTSPSAAGALHGAHVLEFGPKREVRLRAIVGGRADLNASFRDGVPRLERSVFAEAFLKGRRTFSMNALVGARGSLLYHDFLQQFSIEDTWHVNGTSSDRGGVMLTFTLHEPARISRGVERSWARIAAHLAAAHRLRDRLERGEPVATECVLTPGGRIVHAEGEGRGASERDLLRHAVRAIDRARTRGHRDDHEHVLEAWRALVGGRWTVMDEFESDGRRFMIARVNEPAAMEHDEIGALPLRARQIAMRLARGEANKVMAYELGVSTSTVAWHVRRLAERVGARTRVELVRKLAAEP